MENEKAWLFIPIFNCWRSRIDRERFLYAAIYNIMHVPIDISFTAVGIINIPTEKELIAAMEEIREKPLKSA